LLKLLFLPAALSLIDGSSFTGSSITEVSVDEENPHYFTSGGFLVASDGKVLIHYFGSAGDLLIGREYAIIDVHCFNACSSFTTVSFEADSMLVRIEKSAFSLCLDLKSIFIPAHVEFIGDSVFSDCSSLTQLTFESGSHLTDIGKLAFDCCRSLTSICIPREVESIPRMCFIDCSALATLSFETHSRG
jgi:hypothetical protein